MHFAEILFIILKMMHHMKKYKKIYQKNNRQEYPGNFMSRYALP